MWKALALGLALAGAAAVLVAGVVVGSGGEKTALPETSAATGAADVPPRAPSLGGADVITGEPVSLADFAGEPVILHVWASWCAPCAEEAPALARFAAAHADVAILGVDFQDVSADARRFSERFGWEHASIADPQGELAARLALLDLPTTIFLSAEGRIVARVSGPADPAALEKGLERVRQA
jgi:thiol-disulfide isomerase/thioredoxin